MIENDVEKETALRLRRLIEKTELSRSDRHLAERCLRRIEHPLRLTLFGTDPGHAISLLNLMIGQPVVSPSVPRARVQFFHADAPHARVQYRDGSQEKIQGSDFRKLFADNPSKVRIYVDLPVLKKLSIIVAAEPDPVELCSDVEKTLPGADISIWTGGPLGDPMRRVWQELPERLRDHSYLVPSPMMDMQSWQDIAQDFVDVFCVDPRRAQEAKNHPGGVDKVTFKEAGGTQIVRTIKKEIEVLVQSALDTGEVLLARFADQVEDQEEVPDTAALTEETDQTPEIEPVQAEQAPEFEPTPEPDIETIIDRVSAVPLRQQAYSVPLGKLASRSRLLSSTGQNESAQITQRTVSQAMKNMPKKVSRPISKSLATRRVRSRKSRPAATPWSMGL